MKKNNSNDMLSEYDFTKGKRGKYAKQYSEGNNIVVLASDLLKFFPNSETVNETLRAVAKIVQRSKKKAA